MTVNITGLPSGAASAKHGLHVHQSGITVVSSDVTTSNLLLAHISQHLFPLDFEFDTYYSLYKISKNNIFNFLILFKDRIFFIINQKNN